MAARAFYLSGDTENIPEMRALKKYRRCVCLHEFALYHDARGSAEAVKAFHPKVVISLSLRQV